MKRLVLLLIPVAVLAVSCATSPRETASAAQPSCCATNVEATSAFTDKSLYQLDSTWVNDSGHSVKFGALQGRVQVVVMFFASCTYACPILMHDTRRIEAALPETVRANTGFTLITIDPERDTPEALHTYRSIHKLSAHRWTLLQGKPDDILELAALLGVKFKREASGQFAHSNLITVLNERGEIIHQQVGLNQAIEPTVRAIELAVGLARNHASN
jgi:protein SCO1